MQPQLQYKYKNGKKKESGAKMFVNFFYFINFFFNKENNYLVLVDERAKSPAEAITEKR